MALRPYFVLKLLCLGLRIGKKMRLFFIGTKKKYNSLPLRDIFYTKLIYWCLSESKQNPSVVWVGKQENATVHLKETVPEEDPFSVRTPFFLIIV